MFSERLKKLRKDKKITQEALAKILGVERSSIGKYESSGVIPSIDVLKKMSDYFGVSVDYLMTGKEPEGKPEVTEQDLKVALFHGDKEVTDEMWKEVMDFAEMVALKYRYKKNDGNKS